MPAEIYGIIQKVNPDHKHYVGASKPGATVRFKGHLSAARTEKRMLYIDRWIREVGPDKFDVVVLETSVLPEKLDEREKFWIAYYKSLDQAEFNLSIGGYGYNANQSEVSKALWRNPVYRERQRVALSLAGKKAMTGELKARLSLACKKAMEDPKARERRSFCLKKCWKDPEYRERQSFASKKLFEDPDFKKRHRLASIEALSNPIVKRKMSLAQKKRWKDPEIRAKRLQVWRDPEFKKRMGLAIKEGWARRYLRLGTMPKSLLPKNTSRGCAKRRRQHAKWGYCALCVGCQQETSEKQSSLQGSSIGV